eukprot:m.764235 g.764235  ORF g.764235 m.764235 type:complete len:84 (-) comp23214_c0_seq2:72-323(-)
MAQELFRGDAHNGKIDVYAFAVVQWELLTRALPWEDRRTNAVSQGTPNLPLTHHSLLCHVCARCQGSSTLGGTTADSLCARFC